MPTLRDISRALQRGSINPIILRTSRAVARKLARSSSDSSSSYSAGHLRDQGGHRHRGMGSRGGAVHSGPGSQGDTSTGGNDPHPVLADRSARPPVRIAYAPQRDQHADPGEVAWAWVPYEEDPSRGKDRPVLVLAREDARTGGRDGSGTVLVALMATTRDRAPSGGMITDEHGATWVDIGNGPWDSKGRDSEVRADRLLRLDPEHVRREGGQLDAGRFRNVADIVRSVHGWR